MWVNLAEDLGSVLIDRPTILVSKSHLWQCGLCMEGQRIRYGKNEYRQTDIQTDRQTNAHTQTYSHYVYGQAGILTLLTTSEVIDMKGDLWRCLDLARCNKCHRCLWCFSERVAINRRRLRHILSRRTKCPRSTTSQGSVPFPKIRAFPRQKNNVICLIARTRSALKRQLIFFTTIPGISLCKSLLICIYLK